MDRSKPVGRNTFERTSRRGVRMHDGLLHSSWIIAITYACSQTSSKNINFAVWNTCVQGSSSVTTCSRSSLSSGWPWVNTYTLYSTDLLIIGDTPETADDQHNAHHDRNDEPYDEPRRCHDFPSEQERSKNLGICRTKEFVSWETTEATEAVWRAVSRSRREVLLWSFVPSLVWLDELGRCWRVWGMGLDRDLRVSSSSAYITCRVRHPIHSLFSPSSWQPTFPILCYEFFRVRSHIRGILGQFLQSSRVTIYVDFIIERCISM